MRYRWLSKILNGFIEKAIASESLIVQSKQPWKIRLFVRYKIISNRFYIFTGIDLSQWEMKNNTCMQERYTRSNRNNFDQTNLDGASFSSLRWERPHPHPFGFDFFVISSNFLEKFAWFFSSALPFKNSWIRHYGVQ